MKVPISWLKDFVDIPIPIEDLAHRLTMAGLEVEEIRYVGLPIPQVSQPETKMYGLSWEPDKIVIGAVSEVMPHPNADRLVLCRLDDGLGENIVLTGATNLFEYKGKGLLEKSIKVAYAREGAHIYDGHQPGQVLTTLKRAKIRGIDSYSMACSEKELGISDEHEGIIILDEDAPTGVPLVEYMGDAVLEIDIMPNVARAVNILGVAREVAALLNLPLRQPINNLKTEGPSIQGRASIEISEPRLNPRFVLGLVQNVKIGPSPYRAQYRLRLAGMRPINNIVDATNYAMIEVGEPLHAFDYDVLVQRASGKAPRIITRTAQPDERLTTLDGVERTLESYTVLVCDAAGPLSIAGVMGGAESEVSEGTQNILLEGAAWNFINIRKTANAHHLMSEAAYRFSRGVHPDLADKGVRRGLELMRQWAGGVVFKGLVDNYPLPPVPAIVEVAPADVRRWLGIDLEAEDIAYLLRRLEFKVEVKGDTVRAVAPNHRMDINEGIIGKADIIEEIARVYGYERIPETRMADELPPQMGNPTLEREERVRDLLASLGLQEIVTYRMTSPERQQRLLPAGLPAKEAWASSFVHLVNPIASDRNVLRRSLLANVLDIVERNARIRERIALFEIGPIFVPEPGKTLPDELPRLALALSGPRALPTWQKAETQPMDFYDLKGILRALFDALHMPEIVFEAAEEPTYHPGRCARILAGEQLLGVMGELHPLVKDNYDFGPAPVVAGELDLDLLLSSISERFPIESVPEFPPVLEDLALVVDDDLPAERAAEVIRQAGGKMVTSVRLFDVYRGDQIGAGKKSLAYSLSYQAEDRTLTDEEVAIIRQRIVRRMEQELGATLRA
jgi:phenylalanyl-tRNA synthetase beta chain